jgi:arylsulfatase A-like enzyme
VTSTHRTFLVVILAAGVACVGTPPSEEDAGPRFGGPRPNVLVVVTDDQRDGTLGVMPETRRWLGRGGTTFPNAYVTTPLCCPSRATLFTGRFAHNHGVRTNHDAEMLDQGTTLQRFLQDAGYLTAIAGKFLNKWDLSRDPPHFDRWTIFDNGYTGRRFNIDGRLQIVDRYSTDFLAARALAYLGTFEREDQRPWFLYVAPSAPHGPYTPPPRYVDAPVPPWHPSPAIRASVRPDLPSFYHSRGPLPLGRMRQIRADQLRTLMAVDDLVGRLMRKIDRMEELRRTLVVFISDNGFLWGDHGLTTKRLPYTPAIEVPLLMRWSGVLPGGRVNPRPVTNADIAPTVLDAAGVSIPPTSAMDGRSLWEPPRSSRLLFEYWRDPISTTPDWASVRTPRFQYVEYYGPSGRVVAREYYDLEQDPWQLRNLLADGRPDNNPAGLAELSAWLARARRCQGTSGPQACP